MFAVLIVLGVLLFALLKPLLDNHNMQITQKYHSMFQELLPRLAQQQQQQQAPPQVTVISRGGDDRYTRAPQPIRRPYEGSLPSISTRGDYGSYQQMGVLEKGDGTFYPLYGRRTYNRNRFNYYTRTDTYNPVSIPIQYDKRDCTDDLGCNEISNGDRVRVAGNEDVKVKMYNSSLMQ